ncbi:YoaK family protein [Streptomyces sp. ME19-01-6]|uniref:YoaK family protein n=1 Tax=Streptomyces sp. ME19-01-6 TaxID=3028686 RepID=UPI0029B00025|nr:YoaK family protein [Streptomyces sp. ME19-01-6]MDX3229302.1 YoaK family protein [Streptomyces sp. ME19-01-6]
MTDPLPPRDGDPASGLTGGRGRAEPGGGALTAAVALTVATGSMDAVSFLALGGVFTSVMTANLSLLGMSAATRDPALAGHAAVAVGGYVLGSLVSGRIVSGPGKRRLARHALGVEVLALGVLWALWVAAGGHPGGGWRQGLLALAAVAMGGQSALVRAVAPSGVSTTYFTGMLTGLLADLAATGRVRRSSSALLAALVAGAVGGGLLLTLVPWAAPALPTGLVAAVWLGSLVGRARGARGARGAREERRGRGDGSQG